MRRKIEKISLAALFPLLFLVSACFASESAEAKYNAGNGFYRRGDWGKAKEDFEDALRELKGLKKAQALYNLGNADFQTGDFESAAKSYRESLKMDPNDGDAKYNLELAIKMKQNSKKNQQNQQNQQNQNQKQNSKHENESQSQNGMSQQILNNVDQKERDARARYQKQKKTMKQAKVDKDW
jgi:Ca-activated chloride channel family protein